MPLVVNVVELLRWPGSTKDLDVNIAVDDLEFDDARISNEPVHISLHLESLSNGVSVSGTASATWHGECRRCLTPIEERMDVSVAEMYQQETDYALGAADAYAIENDQINLLPMVRENILLAVPLGPLCREDCPGFCPHCGADLSEESCGCENTVLDPRWAALEGLKGRLPEPPK